MKFRPTVWLFSFLASLGPLAAAPAPADERVYVDPAGVIRWSADDREVALFGANYGLPSASDYRAAGYVGADRKQVIEQDMAHLARMGWDGLRLAIWGDWENSDREGNLIVNDHLDLLDYVVHCAGQRGLSMLFTPIHRHSALWPDGKDSDAIQGFSKFYPVSELGTNPAAIAAQQNYLRQILSHVNPYTGLALKDDPAIVFVELINEPEHHPDDVTGSIRYIDALVDAVRGTGCKKILFYNLTQDPAILPAITGSRAQGFTIGWYPTSLGAGRTLTENYLRWVDDYTSLGRELPNLPRIVYEFDSAEMLAPTMYPAMVRAYREIGVQFATMFGYDMLATAPYNLGWQTHYLNLVHSPNKAVSTIIAAEAMRTLPRGQSYGRYPQNCRFGPFRVSYPEDLSEMVTAEQFIYANSTRTEPPQPDQLRRVIGVGSSPVVRYEGRGSYFLEKIDAGRWRLEVYPDAVFVQDPFAQRLNYQTPSSRLLWREWPMRVQLPDLGAVFTARPLNAGNTHEANAADGSFAIRPGVYLLTAGGSTHTAGLPVQLGRVGLREFVCPPAADLPLQVVPHLRAEYRTGIDWPVSVDVIDEVAPQAASLVVRSTGLVRTFPMNHELGYRYRAVVPADTFGAGEIEFSVAVTTAEGKLRFPDSKSRSWHAMVVNPTAPLTLLDAERDGARVFQMRFDGPVPEEYLQLIAPGAGEPTALRLHRPAADSSARHVFSLPIKAAISDRGTAVAAAISVRLHARGPGPLILTLVEDDGTSWSATISARDHDWHRIDVPLTAFKLSTGTKLPLGYPGTWNRDLPPAAGRGGAGDRLHLGRTEHLQVAAPKSAGPTDGAPAAIDLRRAELIFE